MKALPRYAWSNRGRREHIKTEYSPGDIYRYQAIQGAFPTNPLFRFIGGLSTHCVSQLRENASKLPLYFENSR